MKIACVSPYYFPAQVYGGPIESVYQLCLHLNRSGHDLRVLTTNANGIDRVLPGPLVTHPRPGFSVRYYRRLGHHSLAPALLTGLGSALAWADVVYLTPVYSFPTIPTLLLCRLLDRPVMWSPRGSLQRWEGSTRRFAKATWERMCRAVRPRRLRLHLTSEQEADASAARMPDVSQVVIPNGIDIPDVPARSAWNGTLRLLYLGRLHPIKGIELLLGACARLAQTICGEWSLTVAGSGSVDYEAKLKSLSTAAGLAHRVTFVGHANDAMKRRLFDGTDVLVLPSYVENFGMVVPEALAHRVPVVVSHGAPWQRVEEVGCGLWVSNDADSLADALSRMAVLPLREMGDVGRAWMVREYGWDVVAQRMAAEFETLVLKHP